MTGPPRDDAGLLVWLLIAAALARREAARREASREHVAGWEAWLAGGDRP